MTQKTPYHQLFLTIIFSLLVISCGQKPDFYYASGEEVYLSDFEDRWLVVNYWADWCKPCIKEVPELNQFHQQYKDKYSLLALSFDQSDNETLNRQIVKRGIKYRMIASIPKPNLGLQLPAVLPSNIIISPSGKHYGPLVGPQTVQSLVKALEKYQQQEKNLK